jgi:hypothetical protein
MAVYLVRTIDEHDLVGIFNAPNLDELALVVDECLDPGDCEYQRMGTGGIMWTEPAIPIPIELPEGEEDDSTEPDPVPWSAATLTDDWWNSFYGFRRGNWKAFYPDAPKKPHPSPPPRPMGPGRVVPMRKRG